VPSTLLHTTVFYDGSCGLCHRAVQFLLARDPQGLRFRYAPLQGSTASTSLASITPLPDSMVVQTQEGILHTRGEAALVLANKIGGCWRVLSWVGRVFPRFLRNFGYDLIAKYRYDWFGRTSASCPLMTPSQRAFFLD